MKARRCRARPNYGELLAADPISKMREIYGPAKVFDIVVPLDSNGAAVPERSRGRADDAAAGSL